MVTEHELALEQLRRSIENLYTLMADYQPVKDAATKPLRQLGWDALKPYLTPSANLDVYKHFLPRILDLAAFGPDDHLLTVATGLAKSRWQGWSGAEREAVEKYILALWRTLLSAFPVWNAPDWQPFDLADFFQKIDLNIWDYYISHGRFEEYLLALALITQDLGPFLQMWADSDALSAQAHLAVFMVNNADPLKESSRLENEQWQQSSLSKPYKQLIGWLLDPATPQKLAATIRQRCLEPDWAWPLVGFAALEEARQKIK